MPEQLLRGFDKRFLFPEYVVLLSGLHLRMAEYHGNVARAEPEAVQHGRAGLPGKVEVHTLLDADAFGYGLDDAVPCRVAFDAFAEPRDRLVAVDDFLSLAPEQRLDGDGDVALCLVHPLAYDAAADLGFVE